MVSLLTKRRSRILITGSHVVESHVVAKMLFLFLTSFWDSQTIRSIKWEFALTSWIFRARGELNAFKFKSSWQKITRVEKSQRITMWKGGKREKPKWMLSYFNFPTCSYKNVRKIKRIKIGEKSTKKSFPVSPNEMLCWLILNLYCEN